MVAWAHARGLKLCLIEPGKPNQNAYVESFNARIRDACLNTHWFPNLLHARTEIERRRREYNEERPKKGLADSHQLLMPNSYTNRGLKIIPLLKPWGRRRSTKA